jgi:hypothetical protein
VLPNSRQQSVERSTEERVEAKKSEFIPSDNRPFGRTLAPITFAAGFRERKQKNDPLNRLPSQGMTVYVLSCIDAIDQFL